MTTTVLIAGLATISIFVYAVNKSVLVYLALISNDVFGGQIWRLATWPMFVEPPFLAPVIGIALFWYFGKQLEHLLGRTKFLAFVAMLVLIPAVGATVLTELAGSGIGLGGIRFLEDGVIVAFVAAYPTARSFFNLPLWVLAAVILGIDALQYIGDRLWEYVLFLALVIATALIGSRSLGVSELEWIPKVPLPAFITGDPYQKANRARERTQRRTRRSKGADVIAMSPRQTKHLDRADQADMDRLLDKIAASGIDSLSAEERRRLDDHSRRLREQ